MQNKNIKTFFLQKYPIKFLSETQRDKNAHAHLLNRDRQYISSLNGNLKFDVDMVDNKLITTYH